MTEPCNNCGEKATHWCTYHADRDEVYYHCPKHLCPHCEALNASTH